MTHKVILRPKKPRKGLFQKNGSLGTPRSLAPESPRGRGRVVSLCLASASSSGSGGSVGPYHS